MSKTKTNNTRRLIAMGLAAVCLTPALPQAEAAETAEAEPAAQDLGEVVVTAEKHPTQRLDTPENISVITAKEIADNHYQTLAEAAEQGLLPDYQDCLAHYAELREQRAARR